MKYPRLAIASGTVFAACLWTAEPALGVPSFARKYETSCTTCHVVPPKLNAFGRAFKNMGYRMPGGEEDLVKSKEISLGAPAWKRVWPDGVWPTSIPGGQFLAIALNSNFDVNPSAEVNNSFDGIGEVGLLMGGTLGETFSFFGEMALFEDGAPGHIGRLFVQYNRNRFLNMKLGQFEPSVAPFSNHLRLTRVTNYLSNVFPTIPAGNFFGFSPNQRGIELWGGKEGPGGTGGLMYAFGVVNGEFGGSIHALENSAVGDLVEEIESARNRNGNEFDVNSGKDFYAQASYKIGGLGVFGSGGGDSLRQSDNWRDNSLTLGAYYYRGTAGAFVVHPEGFELEPHENETAMAALRSPPRVFSGGHDNGDEEPAPSEREFYPTGNTFYRAGLKFDAWIWDLNIFGNWQRNHDRLAFGNGVYDVDIAMVELNYVTPWPWVHPAIRFEQVRPGWSGSFNRWTPSLTLMLRANTIMTVEGSLSGKSAPNLPPFDDRLSIGLRVYF